MREGVYRHAAVPVKLRVEIGNDAPLGKNCIQLEAKRHDGKIVTRNLDVQIVESAIASFDGTIELAGQAYTRNNPAHPDEPIGTCRLVASDHPSLMGLVGAKQHISLLITPTTKMEKIVAGNVTAANVEDLVVGSRIQWTFRVLFLEPAAISNPGGGYAHRAVVQSLVVVSRG